MIKMNKSAVIDSFIPAPAQIIGSGLYSMIQKMKSNKTSKDKSSIKEKFLKFAENFKFGNNTDIPSKVIPKDIPASPNVKKEKSNDGIVKPQLIGDVIKNGFNKPAVNDSQKINETEVVRLLKSGIDKDIELIEDNEYQLDSLDELIEYQQESIELLKKIEKNTHVDDLKQREDEIENRNREKMKGLLGFGGAANDSKNGSKGLIGDALKSVLGSVIEGAVQAWLGKKLIGGVLGKGSSSGVATAIPGAAKAGIFSRIGSAIKSGSSSILSGAKTGISSIGTKGKALALGASGAMSGAASYLNQSSIVNSSTAILEKGKEALSTTAQSLKPIASSVVDKSKSIVNAITDSATPVIDGIKKAGMSVISNVSDKSSSIISNSKNALESSASLIKDKASNIVSSGKEIASASSTAIRDKATGLYKGATEVLGKGLEGAKTAGSGLKSAAGKILGLPLTVATTLYDVNEVSSDDKLSDSEKKKEYTKIGTKLAGMWAGAKAGAAVGAAGGGAVGSLFAGVGAAPGAAVGGVLGGIAGAFGGAEIGDRVGESIGNKAFTTNPNIVSPDDITVETVIPNPSKTTQEIQTALRLGGDKVPNKVADYVNGKGGYKFEDIKNDYYHYLEKEGIKFDDKTALNAIAKVKQESMQHKIKIESLDKFSNIKYSDPKEIVKKVAENQVQIMSPETSAKNIDDLAVAENRTHVLSTLSNEMDENIFQKMKPVQQQPIIINNNNTTTGSTNINNGDSGARTKLGIPNTRNQDGTIQRLLNNTYKPLMG